GQLRPAPHDARRLQAHVPAGGERRGKLVASEKAVQRQIVLPRGDQGNAARAGDGQQPRAERGSARDLGVAEPLHGARPRPRAKHAERRERPDVGYVDGGDQGSKASPDYMLLSSIPYGNQRPRGSRRGASEPSGGDYSRTQAV